MAWNGVPLHPHEEGRPLSVRNPTAGELRSYLAVLEALCSSLGPRRIVAVGRRAKQAVAWLKGRWECGYVRHPSRGGANRFRCGIDGVFGG